jgi:hypothetical protein
MWHGILLGQGILQARIGRLEAAPDVRFGSKADICAAKSDVCFAPNSDRESGFPANDHVRFTPNSGRVRRKLSCLLLGQKQTLVAHSITSSIRRCSD